MPFMTKTPHFPISYPRRSPIFAKPIRLAFVVFALALAQLLVPTSVAAQSQRFKQALAQAVAKDPVLATFYAERNYKPLWTGNRDRQRRRAFLAALRTAPAHGLPAGRYDERVVRRELYRARTDAAKVTAEVNTTLRFLQFARDIRSGVLEPKRIDENMTLRPPRRDPLASLRAFAKSTPAAYFRALPPQNADYAALLKEKVQLERIVRRGGWGQVVQARRLHPGDTGPAVVQLRARLAAMGYPTRSRSKTYDDTLVQAVARFQADHALVQDGIAGPATLAAVNTSAKTRLMQVVVGLERLRWLNKPLGKRYILVNEAAFRVYVYENGKEIYTSRVVVGQPGRWRTPEFEDEMTQMVINPSWYVPSSIAGKEYLPLLQENPAALSVQDMEMTDSEGKPVNPEAIDFSKFTEDSFPFNLRQRPSGGNALGKVKFLFPNKHAIYLHDTPAKNLFGKSIRAFSHGCIRVQKPFELAYTLLGWQTADPKSLFDNLVATGEETTVMLEKPVPIYLIYRTAWLGKSGRVNYAADSYEVDGKVYNALASAGVITSAARG